MTQLPKLFQLRELREAGYLPCHPRSVQNNARPIGGGAYQAQLGGLKGQALRLVKIGGRFAVAEHDLVDFLRRCGVAIPADAGGGGADADAAAHDLVRHEPPAARRGRPRNSERGQQGGAL